MTAWWLWRKDAASCKDCTCRRTSWSVTNTCALIYYLFLLSHRLCRKCFFPLPTLRLCKERTTTKKPNCLHWGPRDPLLPLFSLVQLTETQYVQFCPKCQCHCKLCWWFAATIIIECKPNASCMCVCFYVFRCLHLEDVTEMMLETTFWGKPCVVVRWRANALLGSHNVH